MKYVKIFNEKMLPIGVIDIEGELPQEASGKFVKVYDKNLIFAGVIELGKELSDAHKTLLVNVYDEDMLTSGTVSASELEPTQPEQEEEVVLP